MFKKRNNNKKTLLAAAALSALEIGSIAGNTSISIVTMAEAADVHVLTEAERIEKGYPSIANVVYYSDGTAAYGSGSVPTFTSHNAFFPSRTSVVFNYNGTPTPGRYRGTIISYDDNSIVLKPHPISSSISMPSNVYHGVINGQTYAAQLSDIGSVVESDDNGDTSVNHGVQAIIDAGIAGQAFKSWKGHIVVGITVQRTSSVPSSCHDCGDHVFGTTRKYISLISAPGAGASPQDTKKHMKEAGIDVEGETIKINKPMDTKDITADGDVTVTGDVEAGGNIHTKGNLDVDGNSHTKGNTEIDGDSTTHGNQTIDGDSRTHGNQTTDGDATIYGNTNMKGDAKVDGDLRVNGDTQLGNDKNNDKVDIYAKTHLHGDTTIGDDEKDKLTVNAASEFKADVTFDKDVHIKGDQTVDGNQTIGGDSHIKGNQEIDKDLTVHGNATVDGDLTTKGDSYTLGNSTIDKDLTVGGSAQIGKDLRVEGITDTGALISRGDAIIGGNTHIYGDTVLDGSFFAKGATSFGDNVDVKKDLSVGGNTTIAGNAKIGGDTVIDGDVYGRSFNVGSERYIDKDGINANGHKIRNIADGEIGPNSLDAVNGRQLWHTREALQYNINQVGAASAAMASLHPLDYEHDDKFTFSTAMGNYKDKTALAAGFFYRPNIKSLFNFSGTLGYGENMFGLGFSTKMGKVSEVETLTDEQLRDKIATINDDNKELREKNNSLESKMAELKNRLEETIKKDVEQENKISALTAQNADLKKGLSDMTKAYQTLIHKVDGMAEELAIVKTK